MITDTVKKQITDAMKARDSVRLSTLKMLSSELHNEQISKQKDLTDDDEMSVVKKEVKKRRDAIEAYDKAGNTDKSDLEKQELAILEEYLPEQMSDEELQKIVDEVVSQTGASSMQDMGKVMGMVVGKVEGKADGGRISAIVKAKLST
jgi:hypothetical protein